MVSIPSGLGRYDAGNAKGSGRRDVMIIGTISKLTKVPGGLLVEVAVTKPHETSVTLVRQLSGDADTDQAQVTWYEQMRETATELRFQCSRSAPFNASRIEQAGPNDDLSWLESVRDPRGRVARSLEHATEVLQRVNKRPVHKQIGEMLDRQVDAPKRHQ